MNLALNCFVTFIACWAISIHYNVKGKLILFAAIGGGLTFFVYGITAPVHSIIMQNFLATIAASIYSESLARFLKVPATTFLIISVIPLVPGSNIYRAMELCINNEFGMFASAALEALGIAGAIALGILLVSSLFRFAYVITNFKLHKRQ